MAWLTLKTLVICCSVFCYCFTQFGWCMFQQHPNMLPSGPSHNSWTFIFSSGGKTEGAPRKPVLKDLIDALYHKVADKWKMIGVLLEIPKGTLAGIAEKCQHDPHKCLLEMLETWLERIHPPPSWATVIERQWSFWVRSSSGEKWGTSTFLLVPPLSDLSSPNIRHCPYRKYICAPAYTVLSLTVTFLILYKFCMQRIVCLWLH